MVSFGARYRRSNATDAADGSVSPSEILRDGHFNMDFAQSAAAALDCVHNAGDASLILTLSDINMPGNERLELLPKAQTLRPDVPVIIHGLWGRRNHAKALENGADALLTQPIYFNSVRGKTTPGSNGRLTAHYIAAVRESASGTKRTFLLGCLAAPTGPPRVISSAGGNSPGAR
jgi:CheY-like chemotaxis protein